MLFSVVIPMYNESRVIADTFRRLTETLEREASRGGWRYEVLFSDDGSDDGSGDIVRREAAGTELLYGEAETIRSDVNRGKGAAVRMGMLRARGDWRLFTDSDLAYGPEKAVSMLNRAAETNTAVLAGSRAADEDGYAGYTPVRKLASRAYLRFLSAAAGFRHSDSQCGIKVFRADAAEDIFSRVGTDGWAFDFEALMLADRLGYSVEEAPVRVLTHGSSKIRLVRDSVGMLREIGRIRRRLDKEFPDPKTGKEN